MHSLLTSQKLFHRILRHLFLFVTMVLLFAWVAYSRSHKQEGFLWGLVMVFTNALFFFAYAYLTVYLLIPRFLVRRRIFLFILLFLGSGLVLSLLKFVFSDYIFYQAIAPETRSAASSLSAILVNTKDMTFIVAIFALVRFARDHYMLESNILELQKKSLEAELKLIEHQMDPHVIFNNFNNLYSLSIYRPEHLKPTVKKLKALLHYLFTESKSQEVLLSKELEMIQNYMGMEQLRYGDRLDSSFHLEGNVNGLVIAPLILYSFVENCFVHGAGEDPRKSWITIKVNIRDSRLTFVAANSVSDQAAESRSNGHRKTSENSVRRLELQYPNSHRLTIREKRNEHIVELNLSL